MTEIEIPNAALERELKLPIQFVRGFPFPGYPMYTKENIESALDYVARKADIFVCTYPKSGTTWVQYILWEILHHAGPLPSMEDMCYRLAPYTELAGAKAAQDLPTPRLLKCHLPYHLIPKNPLSKYIYVVRNPKDVLVSRYFFTQDMAGIPIPLDSYYEAFIAGNLAHGKVIDHVLSWYPHRHDDNVLLLSYEHLREDPCTQLFKMAEFLGEKYLKMLNEDEALVTKILEHTSFEYMKKNLLVAVPMQEKDSEDLKSGSFKETSSFKGMGRRINFFRKGVAGDWKNHLSVEQSERMDAMISQKCQRIDICDLWD